MPVEILAIKVYKIKTKMLGNNKGGIPRKTERGGTRNTGSEKEMNW